MAAAGLNQEVHSSLGRSAAKGRTHKTASSLRMNTQTRMSLQHASRLAVAYRLSTVLSVPGMLLLEMEVT